MSWIEAIILGIIQGLTEFLPVSSSGHLELAKMLFGDNMMPNESMQFTVIVHFATALSTIVVFRKDILEILQGLTKPKESDSWNFSIKIILSMIPAAIIGVLFDKQIETFFAGNIILVGICLIVTAVLLYFADKAKSTEREVTILDSIIIGVAQAIAILPGISRSGATISTSVLLGIDKSKAARFSFLMVVPLIFGKIAKDILDNPQALLEGNTLIMALGFISAFVTGIFACTWMIALVKKSNLKYFALYCLIVGIVSVGISFLL